MSKPSRETFEVDCTPEHAFMFFILRDAGREKHRNSIVRTPVVLIEQFYLLGEYANTERRWASNYCVAVVGKR